MRITYLVEKIGPYHAFRLSSISNHNLTIIETRPSSKRYTWKETLDFESISLPPGSKWKDLWNLIRNSNPEILYITGYGFIEMLWAIAYGIYYNIPIVMLSDTTVADEPKSYIKEKIKEFLVSHVQTALVAGMRSRKYLISLGLSDKNIFEPYDIIDNDYYALKSGFSPMTVPYFICVSRLIPYKNLPYLINAFTKYKMKSNDNVHLVILGDGGLEKSLVRQIAELGMSSTIHLKGFLINAEVRNYYQWAEALILASVSEAWGLCINEAMAAGIPVLATNVAGACEDLVINGLSGFTFSPFDEESLIEKMGLVRSLSSTERLTLIENAKNRLKRFSLENFLIGFNNAASMAKSFKINHSFRWLKVQMVLLIARFAF